VEPELRSDSAPLPWVLRMCCGHGRKEQIQQRGPWAPSQAPITSALAPIRLLNFTMDFHEILERIPGPVRLQTLFFAHFEVGACLKVHPLRI
jgi:hypothetical protein